MPLKLLFPRNDASSYERKSHVLRANERVAWVEQRNFAVFTRYPLSDPTHRRPLTIHKFPLFFTGQRWIPPPPLPFQTSEIAPFSSVSSSGLATLSLSLHRRSTVDHIVIYSRQGTTKFLGEGISEWSSRVNWSTEGKKRRRVGEKIPCLGERKRFEIPVPSSSSMST